MNVLLHVNPEPACCVINGTLHKLEPRVPYVVDEHVPEREGTGLGSMRAQDDRPVNIPFITEKIVEHLWYCGVVHVCSERTPYGTDQITERTVEEAMREAELALLDADQKTFEEYRSIQEERAVAGRPPLVPTGRYKAVIERRGIDIRKYGINPVGSQIVDPKEVASQAMEVANLTKQLDEQRQQTARVMQLLEQLMAEKAEAKPEEKGKKKVTV